MQKRRTVSTQVQEMGWMGECGEEVDVDGAVWESGEGSREHG